MDVGATRGIASKTRLQPAVQELTNQYLSSTSTSKPGEDAKSVALCRADNTFVPQLHYTYRIYNFSALKKGVYVAVIHAVGFFWAIVGVFEMVVKTLKTPEKQG